jgi:hypothetical protein
MRAGLSATPDPTPKRKTGKTTQERSLSGSLNEKKWQEVSLKTLQAVCNNH